MLKVRIIPTLLMREVNLVKGPAFNSWRSVGAPMQSVKVFNRRDVDELILLDIAATSDERGPDIDMVKTLAEECFVPLTIGGGIRTTKHIRDLLLAGADKIAINTASYENPKLIADAADQFGTQCIVSAIDYRIAETGKLICYSHSGTVSTGRDPIDWSKELEQLGAGEILLTCIERDGTMEGYDTETLMKVSSAISIPVIASGGASNYADMARALEFGAAAVAASSIYLFTQATPLEAKAYLQKEGFPMRQPFNS